MNPWKRTIVSVALMAAGSVLAGPGCNPFDGLGGDGHDAGTDFGSGADDDCGECGWGGGDDSGGGWRGGGDDGSSAPPPPRPNYPPTTVQTVKPPPVSGGTLIVLADGKTAVAADPDRDAVYVVDLVSASLTRTVALQMGDEPGRLVEDGAGRVHVALRGAGSLVTIDPKNGTVIGRRSVCPAPRGVVWDPGADVLYVACATGELVSLPPAGGSTTRTVVIERDLRDVLVQSGAVSVTKLRSAELLRLDGVGAIARRDAMPKSADEVFVPHVAWRAVPAPSGGVLVVHQRETTASVDTHVQGGWGSTQSQGGGTVESVLTLVDATGRVVADDTLLEVVVPVDVAISGDGKLALVASLGNAYTGSLQRVVLVEIGNTVTNAANERAVQQPTGQIVAVAFDGMGRGLALSRDAALWILPIPNNAQPTMISLGNADRHDTGHDVFHSNAGGLIACASCHPEGRDDGHTWKLDGELRRTPSLRGTIDGTAPYHWRGDLAEVPQLLTDVYTGRMNGANLDVAQADAVTAWVKAIPVPAPPSWIDPAAVQRGKALFEGSVLACSSCHSGAKLTNNATVDVGTGGAFQVPPLVGVGWRTPLLHDGCAKTLLDRFGACANPKHGNTGAMTDAEKVDIAAYLESL